MQKMEKKMILVWGDGKYDNDVFIYFEEGECYVSWYSWYHDIVGHPSNQSYESMELKNKLNHNNNPFKRR